MNNKYLLIFSALVILSLLLATCAAPPTPTPELPDPAGPDVPEVPADTRVLRVTFSWPNRIDPAVGNDYASSTSLANLYDTLVFPTADGGVRPALAESWDVSTDGLIYTFHLRTDVTFHDGTPLKASDVVYSFNRLAEIGEGFAYLVTPHISEMKTLDDYTVEITLVQPSALFLASLVRLYVANEAQVRANTNPVGPYGENGDYGKEWLQTNDAGSGPYTVKEFPLEQHLLMEKFNNWWGEFHPNAADEVRFIGTTEAVTVRSLMQNNQLEISDQWQSFEAYEALERIEGVEIAPLPSMSSFYYMVNNKKAPTDDIHCRKAMAYAFDYDVAVSLEWPGTQQMKGPVPAGLAGHNPNVYVFKRDLDRAREELAQCQYAAEIASYPIVLQWVAEVPDEEKWALLFQSNLAEIGMPVEVVQVPWLSLVENTSQLETSPNIATIYVSSDLPEAGLMLNQRYHSSTAATWQQNEWLEDPNLDALIEDALATLDDQERYSKYHVIQDYLVDIVASMWIYDQVEKHAYRTCVDWPAVRDETSIIMGYQLYAADIGVDCP
jgi:peptide/nickel transport system substrate-binding protein